MDPQTILIGVTAFVVSALLIYLISAFTMREKTFEEVMAEQKRRQEEERERAKLDKRVEKEQYKKKFKKGKADKSKEKAAQVSEPELKEPPKVQELVITERKMVNLEIDPEIIEPSDQVVLGSKSKSKGGRKKSILHNKDEVAPVVEKAPELPHKQITPRDEIELKKLHDMEVIDHVPATHTESTPKKEKRQQAEMRHEVKEAVKEVRVQKLKATQVETMEMQHSAPLEMSEKKQKSKNSTVEGAAVSESRLIDTVRTASLSEKDVQTLIEILLNRQSTAATPESWNKKSQKGDPMSLMKKQLEEKERALQQEQQLAMSAGTKVKELRNELTAERTKLAALEKHFQEKMALQGAEVEAMQARMRHAHEQHMVEAAEMRARMQQLEQAGDATLVQKLKQENKILQDSLQKSAKESVPMVEVNNLRQKVSIMEKELASNVVKLNAAESAKKSLDDKVHKYEDQMRKLESTQKGSDDVLSKKLDEVNAELRKSESKNASLSKDLNSAHSAVRSSEKEVHTMKQKLRELEQHLSAGDANKEMGAKLQESERNIKNLERQLTNSVAQQEDMSAQLQKLRQENHALAEEVRTTKERQQGEGQESPATNGDIHKDAADKNVIQIQEHERILSEKTAELTKLQKELEAQRSAVSTLQVSAAEVKDLKEQLEAQKQKNNELREKNWKAMEALDKAEKSASEKVDKSLKSSREEMTKAVSDLETLDKGMMQRLFPAVSVNDKLAHKEWIVAFEKQAAQHMAKVSSSEKGYSDKLSHLTEENSRLQADVEVFKNNIAILHSEKDRVKELEEENRKLHQQAQEYEKNFSLANADQERLLHIQEENQRLKASLSHSSSTSEDLSRLREENKQLQSSVEEYKQIVSESERKLHDLERSVETEEKKWKEKLQQAQESSEKSVEFSSREKDLEELTIQQQTQLEEYRNVLASTEAMLSQLESRAESEEKKWESRLQKLQTDLQQSKSECQRLLQEMQSLGGSTEMQLKVESLESELQESSERIIVLTTQNQELTSKVIVLETETKAVSQLDTDDVKKQLDEIQRLLEAERKKNKELSSTLVRLNGIIKTGQDALAQEQKLVQQLQEQLSDKAKSSGGSASQEMEQGNSTSNNDLGTSV